MLHSFQLHHQLKHYQKPSISPILGPLQNSSVYLWMVLIYWADLIDSLSAIIICRFFLDIRQRNQHPNQTTSTPQTIGSFHAATQQLQNAIMEEFGDPAFNMSSEEYHPSEHLELPQVQANQPEPFTTWMPLGTWDTGDAALNAQVCLNLWSWETLVRFMNCGR